MTKYGHQKLAFARENNYATSPISSASTEIWNLFGYNTPWGDFPTEVRELLSQFTGAASTPAQNYFTTHAASGSIAGSAINMILLQMAMTKVSNVTNSGASDPYTHKWTTRPVGETLDSLVMRAEDGNDTVKIYNEILGNYIQNIVVAMDLSQQSNMMTFQLNTAGQRIDGSPAVTTDATNIIYPGSTRNHYMLDTNFEVIWAGNSSTDADGFDFYADDGSGTDITDDVANYALTINNTLHPDQPQSQDYPDDYIIGEQIPMISFDLLRRGSNSKQVYDDFIAMQDNTTTKSLHIKQYQTSSHYVELWLEDVTLGRVGRPNTVGTNQEPVFRCNGMLKDINVKAVDGLAGGTYYA